MDEYSILVVEDNPDDQVLTVRALKQASNGSEIIVLEDGQQAIDFLFGPNSDPDAVLRLGVVLMDIKLPRVNGLEVLRTIRAEPTTNWLPVVMVTSSDEPGEQIEAYRLGANSYVRKPVDFSEFTNHMRILASYWLQVNRLPPPELVPKTPQTKGIFSG
ncbi:response regulator [Marinobacter xestospongiae]|uniref:Response regulator n=1 Tax=Marinobacter xestospongiae TaxID=994319 RepID=A0ABU3W293_9GAMM|nr:response regulator [Marinobacter xestospongiae]MCG8519570.1 response regulator [Pseudomonadales bacterium]MCK7568618.1 response regulator [Marinobacter xestospongiae]MDV2080665.1 response regulator [Marinobacter xestospongiae]